MEVRILPREHDPGWRNWQTQQPIVVSDFCSKFSTASSYHRVDRA